MQEDPPLRRRKLDFGALSSDEFEALCFLVIHLEFPDAVRLCNPDGGADAGAPTADRSFTRCWQSKRFTGQISWSQCRRSLEDAVSTYGMPHYTFCFARDLTGRQEKNFRRELVERYMEVRVDYWGHSKIEAMLLGSDQGQRIVGEFYGDPAYSTRALMRAIRAVEALESGVDVLERLGAVAEHLAHRDPFYAHTTVTREAGSPPSSGTPSAIMAVERDDASTIERIEAIPRNINAIEPPEGTLYFDDTPDGRLQQERLRRFFEDGGRLQLDDVRFELRNLSPLFEDMYSETGAEETGTVVLTASRRPTLHGMPASWPTLFGAGLSSTSTLCRLTLQPRGTGRCKEAPAGLA